MLVPSSWLLLGLLRIDLLHGAYLLWLALLALYGCGGLMPQPVLLAQRRPPSHRVARTYASLHLLALYVAMVGQLPGLGVLQRCGQALYSSGVQQTRCSAMLLW